MLRPDQIEALTWAIDEAEAAIGGKDPESYDELNALVEVARQALTIMSTESPLKILSPQETEVIKRIAAGYSPAQMAEELGLSVKTVSTYRARIMQKLGLQSNAEMAILVFEFGMAPSVKAKLGERNVKVEASNSASG